MRQITKVNLIRQIFGAALLATLLLVGATTATQAANSGVTLTGTPNSNTVTVGQSASYTIKINRDNYTDKVTLSATGLPAGVTAAFSPNVTTATSSILKLQTTPNTPIGIFNINIKGAANAIAIAPIVVELRTTKATGSFSISAFPQSQSIIAGQSTSYEIRLNRDAYDGLVRFAAENVPSGVTVVFEPAETTGSSTRAYLYSNGLSNFPANYEIVMSAFPVGELTAVRRTPLRLLVGCELNWSQQFGNPSSSGNDDLASAVATRDGHVYVAGHTNANGSRELWVAKYTLSGSGVWMQPISLQGLSGFEKTPRAMAVDAAGNVYVAGYTQTNSQRVNYDVFMVKLDQNGTQLFQNVFGTVQEDGKGGMEVNFDNTGRAVLTAAMDLRHGTNSFFDINRITFDANLSIVSGWGGAPFVNDFLGDAFDLTVGGDGSVYVIGDEWNFPTNKFWGWLHKFSSNGRHDSNFTTYYQDSTYRNPKPKKVAVDANNNAFVALGVTLNGKSDFFLIKRDANGNGWAVSINTAENDFINDLKIASTGDIFIAGKTEGSLAAANPGGGSDAWLAKYASSDGSAFFVRQFAVAGDDDIEAIKLDQFGNLLAAGSTYNFTNTNYGQRDALLLRYIPSPTPFFSSTRITRLNPTAVRSGASFIIEGVNLSNVEGVFWNGQPLAFTVNSSSQITVTAAPNVSAARTANVTISAKCHQYNSPTQLAITP